MKTILFVLFLFFCACSFGQLFATLEPTFQRPGLLYNTQGQVGLYGKAWYGNMNRPEGFHAQNIKIGVGLSFLDYHPLSDVRARWLIGINYNYFFDVENSTKINVNRVHVPSADLGIIVIMGRFSLLIMEDLFNWESCLGVSFKFKKI